MKLKFNNNANLLNNIKPYKKMKLKEINYEKNLSLNNSLNLIHSNLTKKNDILKDSTIIVNWKKMVKNKFTKQNFINPNFQSNSVKNLFDLKLKSKKHDIEVSGIYKGSSRNISFEKNFYSLRNISNLLNKSKKDESTFKYIENYKLLKEQNKNNIINYNSDYENKIIIPKEN